MIDYAPELLISCYLQALLSLDTYNGTVTLHQRLSRDVVQRLTLIVIAKDYVTALSCTGQGRNVVIIIVNGGV